jgi:carbon monoxide dehydrogenase subunit G
MKLAGDYLFEATVPEVWSALFDPVILAAVMPGCEKLELVDGHYVGEIKVKVGPIQGNFTGKVDLKDKVEPVSYTMIVDGRGAPGFVKATAMVKLQSEGEGTRVFYDTDAQVGGKIASVGQRLLEASARAIVAQSLEGLHANIKLRAAAFREVAQAPRSEASPPPAVAAESITAAGTADTREPAKAGPSAKPGDEGKVSGPAAGDAGKGPADSAGDAGNAASASPSAAASSTAQAGASSAAQGSTASSAGAAAVVFTPVKTKQSALANAVAKEVASTLFPRSVLVGIILIQAAVIVWLLLRH